SVLNDAVNYRCVVTAANGTTNSSYAPLTVTTSPPGAPIATTATTVSSNGFTANWNNPGAATGYRLDLSTNNTFSNFVSGYQDLDVGNVYSRTVTGLVVSVTYYYRVRAYNPYGTSGNSGAISVTTVVSAPPAPTALPATSVATSEFT